MFKSRHQLHTSLALLSGACKHIQNGDAFMSVRILVSSQTFIENYITAVELSGATPIAGYLPGLDLTCDGLLLSGGVDLNPALYNEDVNGSVDINNERDAHEMMLLDAFVKAGKPVFGICRGCQLINVYFGGTLSQHMPQTVLHRSGEKPDREHEVESASGSIMEALYGKRCVVNSVHHQAVKKLGKDLIVTQKSDDGIIEAYEHKDLPIIAVQWHPERLVLPENRRNAVDGNKLFAHFINMCK